MAKKKYIHPTRIFKTPEELEKVWDEYKLSLEEEAKKWENIQYVGKDGFRAVDHPKIPYTLEGFKVYCRKTVGEAHHYFVNTDKRYDEFCTICRVIKEEIRNDQITGGLLGFYNPSITQRLNNLKEHTENINTTEVKLLNVDPLDDSED